MINTRTFDNYSRLSSFAARIVLEELAHKPDLTLCVATGNSPTGTYEQLVLEGRHNPQLFRAIRVLKLDEWGGFSADDPGSCEHYLRKNLVTPLDITEDRFEGFRPMPENAESECRRVQHILETTAPIDLCVLGLGKNGHLGFNEPADFLHPDCHVAELSEMTKAHGMVGGRENKPEYGMTLGMKNILSSRRIILLVCGSGKEEAYAMLQSGKITTRWPVTLLRLHPQVDCLVEQAVNPVASS